MKENKRIYCVEGHHDWGPRQIEPTVEPLLQLLKSTGYWEDYVRRNSATRSEFEYFIEREWCKCSDGSILYFATHGDSEEIMFSDSSSISLIELSEMVVCEGRYIHFGGCSTFDTEKNRVREFIRTTRASAVSGYRNDVDWADVANGHAPALALELILFSSIQQNKIDLTDGRSAGVKLPSLEADLQRRFPECCFHLLTRWDK